MLILGLHIVASRSSAICNLYSICASVLETRVDSTRGVPSWICGLSSCQHLLGFVQLLLVSFHSVLLVLMYLNLLLVVTVANELATLRCVSLAVSASQESNVGRISFEILLESSSTLLVFVNASFSYAPHHAVLQQSCILDVSVRQSFLVFELFSCEDQSITSVILASKLHYFFTRASWATTVILTMCER